MSEQSVHLFGLFCEGLTKHRMDIRTGIEVALPANAFCGLLRCTHVVAVLRMIEGQLHKPGKRNRT